MVYRFEQHLLLTSLMVLTAAATFLFVGTEDAEFWLLWTQNVIDHGLAAGYRLNEYEHPPLLSILLLLSAKAGTEFGLHVYYGIKLGLLVFLIASTTIIYYWSQRDIIFTFFCYLFLVLSSLCLAYIDIYFFPPLLLAFYFLSKNRVGYGVFCFTIAVFVKYPPLIIAPFILVYLLTLLLQEQGDGRKITWIFFKTLAIPTLCVMIPVFLYFGMEPVYALKRAFEHGYLSGQALNANWIVTRIIQIFPQQEFNSNGWHNDAWPIWVDSSTGFTLTRIMVSLFYLSALIRFLSKRKTIESLLLFCIIGHMSYFMFNHGVHENHLFVSCILAISLACINPQFKSLAITLSAISSINLIAFYGFSGTQPMIWPFWYLKTCLLHPSEPLKPICDLATLNRPYFDLRLLLAIFNVVYFLYLWKNIVFAKQTTPTKLSGHP